ncbi:MAG: 50S ribosomal protein L21 [Candidatus Zixiibacteriota bacterium]|nr:MAG: 50S ribosomal protein L21 [candidate division Zixibacteria bacterium]
MYAVFELAGMQFSASEGDVLKVPLQEVEQGNRISITDVLLVKTNGETKVGKPYLDNAVVEAEVLGHGQGDKVQVYKYKRRTKYRRRQGHRQDYSEIKIDKIVPPKS